MKAILNSQFSILFIWLGTIWHDLAQIGTIWHSLENIRALSLRVSGLG